MELYQVWGSGIGNEEDPSHIFHSGEAGTGRKLYPNHERETTINMNLKSRQDVDFLESNLGHGHETKKSGHMGAS